MNKKYCLSYNNLETRPITECTPHLIWLGVWCWGGYRYPKGCPQSLMGLREALILNLLLRFTCVTLWALGDWSAVSPRVPSFLSSYSRALRHYTVATFNKVLMEHVIPIHCSHTQGDSGERYACIIFAYGPALESWPVGKFSSSFLTSLSIQWDPLLQWLREIWQ